MIGIRSEFLKYDLLAIICIGVLSSVTLILRIIGLITDSASIQIDNEPDDEKDERGKDQTCQEGTLIRLVSKVK